MHVVELSAEHRDRMWLDSTGDYWKFNGGVWLYQKGTPENEWESTDTDEEPNGYGPFELADELPDLPGLNH